MTIKIKKPKEGSIASNEQEDIVHHGVKYYTVVSPYTNRIWLDRNINWSKIDGNSVCPVNFRVPTYNEFINEELYSEASLYNSFLKIPLAGAREPFKCTLTYSNQNSYLWTASIEFSSYYDKKAPLFLSINGFGGGSMYASGHSVRCIKD